MVPWARMSMYRRFWTFILERSATDAAYIVDYTGTVPEKTEDSTISFGLWDMIGRFRDCLGWKSGALYMFWPTYLLTYLIT